MKKYKGSINIGFVSTQEFEFELDDDATKEEIEEAAKDEAFGFIDWHFEEVKEND